MNILDKMYDEKELERINDIRALNEKMEIFFEKKRTETNDEITPILDVLYENNFKSNNSKKIIDAQAKALKMRQDLNSSISKYSQKLAKAKSEDASIRQNKLILYTTNFGLKTNLGEKKILIEAHLAENERKCHIFEIQIEFLRSTLETLESYQYSVKNVISLMDYLGSR